MENMDNSFTENSQDMSNDRNQPGHNKFKPDTNWLQTLAA